MHEWKSEMKILKDFSTSTLTTANKANLFSYFEYLGTSTAANVEFHDSAEIKWMLTRLSYTFPNNVLSTRFNADDVGRRIEETLALFKSKDVNHLTWWVEPDARPTTLGEVLTAKGLTFFPGMPAMAADLQELNEDISKPPDLIIEPVNNREMLQKWVQPGLIGFGDLDLKDGDLCFELFNGLGFGLPLRLYLATLNGKPVASSQLFLGAGVAGVYWVATVPEARRQGIGAAISLAPLLDARDMGYRIGILQASSMGEPVYRRLGFRKHGLFSNYTWNNNK